MDKKISDIIEKSKQSFDRDTHRYELLIRSDKFFKQLNTIKKKVGGSVFFKLKHLDANMILRDERKNNILIKYNYPEIPKKERKVEHRELTDPIHRSIHLRLDNYLVNQQRWQSFCDQWNLRYEWDGKIRSIKEYVVDPIDIMVFDMKDANTVGILIRINNWTTLKDIQNSWSLIEKWQNRLWRRKRQEKRPNFMRDLCWYDLYNRYGYKPRQISEIWIENSPEDIDALVIRRIKDKIDKNDMQGRCFEESELINEVKFGFLSEKYKFKFEEEKEYYLTGKTERGKKIPPFLELIRSAIKRMKAQIAEAEDDYGSGMQTISLELFSSYLHPRSLS